MPLPPKYTLFLSRRYPFCGCRYGPIALQNSVRYGTPLACVRCRRIEQRRPEASGLVLQPQTLQDGEISNEYVARELDGVEYDEWWERSVAAFPAYADYQTMTT